MPRVISRPARVQRWRRCARSAARQHAVGHRRGRGRVARGRGNRGSRSGRRGRLLGRIDRVVGRGAVRVVRGDRGVVDGGGEFLGVVTGRVVAGVDGGGVAQRPLASVAIIGADVVVVGGVGLRGRLVGVVGVLRMWRLLVIWRAWWGLRGLLLRARDGRARVRDVLTLGRWGCCSVARVNVSSYREAPVSRRRGASRKPL